MPVATRGSTIEPSLADGHNFAKERDGTSTAGWNCRTRVLRRLAVLGVAGDEVGVETFFDGAHVEGEHAASATPPSGKDGNASCEWSCLADDAIYQNTSWPPG